MKMKYSSFVILITFIVTQNFICSISITKNSNAILAKSETKIEKTDVVKNNKNKKDTPSIIHSGSVVKGRYIKLQYDRKIWLNLDKIKVYSKNGGPNIITPNTPVTKSSGYQGDKFPSNNFVNGPPGKHYNFVHTSGDEIPWIQVDLGSMVEIYKIEVYNRVDCCQDRIVGTFLQIMNDHNIMVYESNKITSVEMIYTWFPTITPSLV